MTISEAVKLAVENGWKDGEEIEAALYMGQKMNLEYVVLLDKNFWIALGKGMGWKEEWEQCLGSIHCKRGVDEKHNPCIFDKYPAQWKTKWHEFLDCLIGGGTPDSYFSTLATKYK